MLGGSEVVVGTSIVASYDLMHASWCCGGPLPRPRPLRTITPLNDSPRDLSSNAELRLPRERGKYKMLGSSEVVVGTSIASYDLMHASWCCDGPLPRPRPLRTLTTLSSTLYATSTRDFELSLPQERTKYAMLGTIPQINSLTYLTRSTDN